MTHADEWMPDRQFPTMSSPGKVIRLGRLVGQTDGRCLFVTIAHGLLRGPIPREVKAAQFGPLARELCGAGADGIVVSPGFLGCNAAYLAGHNAKGIILCLEWNNSFRDMVSGLGFSEGRSAMIGTIEDAVRLGADAVMTYVFLGHDDPEVEAAHVSRNAALSRECERLGVVRVIETMSRGGRMVDADTRRKDYVAMHARIASEIGCDLIKTEWTGDEGSFREVVEACLVPVLVAGGPQESDPVDALRMVEQALRAGAIGVVFGRNIIQASNPVGMVTALHGVVHQGMTPNEAGKRAGLKS